MSDPQIRRPSARAAIEPLWAFALAAAIAAGFALRLWHLPDIEWKSDEQWSIANGAAMAAGEAWRWLGMPSSVGEAVPNPGLSLWVFAGLIKLLGSSSPPLVAGAIAFLNGAAIVAFVLVAARLVPEKERSMWFWAAALWALNPLAILFERKIWPPSTLLLPFVVLLTLMLCRRSAVAAFFWGMLGTLMAQVHMGAGFLACALLFWTVWRDRGSFSIAAWVGGSVAGLIPAIPWFVAMAHATSNGSSRLRFPIPSFYVRWFLQPFGLGSEYTLGGDTFVAFLGWPLALGWPTYLVAMAHLVAAAAALASFVIFARWLYRARPPMAAVIGGQTVTERLIAATFFGYGGVLTLITIFGAGSHRHYMIFIAPVMALWVPYTFARSDWPKARVRRILLSVCIAEAVISAGLFSFIHERKMLPSEYGSTWQSQQRSTE